MRWDLLLDVSTIQSAMHEATVETIKHYNRTVQDAHDHAQEVCLRFVHIPLPHRMESVNDSAFKSSDKGKPRTGQLVRIAHDGPKLGGIGK